MVLPVSVLSILALISAPPPAAAAAAAARARGPCSCANLCCSGWGLGPGRARPFCGHRGFRQLAGAGSSSEDSPPFLGSLGVQFLIISGFRFGVRLFTMKCDSSAPWARCLLRDQLVVGAPLGDLPLGHDDDVISLVHELQLVRDQQRPSPSTRRGCAEGSLPT